MTPEEFEKAMQEIFDNQASEGDTENSHWLADALICSVLKKLGYDKGVEIFHKLPKWYA